MTSVAILRTDVILLCRDGAYHKAFLKLLSSGFEAGAIASVWRYLYRQVRASDSFALTQEVRRRMSEVALYCPEIALDDADQALRQQRPERARALLEAAYGAWPTDPEVRLTLFRAVERSDPARALQLIEVLAEETPEAALKRIDLLRGIDRVHDAMTATDEAMIRFGELNRLWVRKARIYEALQEWEAALDVWCRLLEADPEDDPSIWLRVVQLAFRLQRMDERDDAVLGFLASRPDVVAHAEMAEHIDDTQFLEAALLTHCVQPQSEDTAKLDAALFEILLNTGQIGLAQYLNSRRGPLLGPLSTSLQDGQKIYGWPEVPRTPAVAARVKSPSCLLPLSPVSGLARPDYGFDPVSDRLLLVNSSLNAGGAERQLVMLVESLLNGGMPKENIHVALFSLVRDRRQAHFMEDLEALGVVIHNLRQDYMGLHDKVSLGAEATLLPSAMRRDVAMLTPLVRALRPKVVHAWQDRPALSAGWVCAQELVPRLVISTRNMTPSRRGGTPIKVDRDLLRALACLPNTVLSSNSSAGARDYEDWLDLPDGSVHLLPNGIEVGQKPLRRVSKRPGVRVRGVFRFSHAKRPFLWLDTMALLQDIYGESIEPTLYGTGPLEAEMRRHAEQIGLVGLKFVTGEKDRNVIYGGADLVLLMSQVEGTPNVLLEAQAEGLLVAGCDVGGTRDAMFEPGVGPDAGSLLMLPGVTARTAAELLKEWLPSALKSPRAPRRNHVKKNFSSEALGRISMSLYQMPPGVE